MVSTGKERQAALAARRRAAGLVQVQSWVHQDRKAELVAFAATLTEPAQVIPSAPPAPDPRQIDIEEAIRATAITPPTDNQVIDTATTVPAICPDIRDAFRADVRAARIARGWGQRQLAEQAGVPQSSVARLEKRGPKHPTPAHVTPILAALGLSEDGGATLPHKSEKPATRP
jgi:DNA-binding XRE family transcriptional regulator